MPYSRYSLLIVEDDSRTSRHLRDHLEASLENVRIEIAGSPARARTVCEKFPPDLILWDGAPNERGTAEEYANCIPEGMWNRVLPISEGDAYLAHAHSRGALAPCPKRHEAVRAWCVDVLHQAQAYLAARHKKKKK